MILHFSHIGLTDGLTFMIPFGWSLRPALAAGTAAATASWCCPHAPSFGAFEQDSGW
ncbi:MAG TPA: hypothetical protein VIJ50_01445 [Solirubrobacteraceae bacterium]